LVVDDEPMVRQSIVFLLKHLGHTPETADAPRAALNLLKQRGFDIVITDFSMPEMLGDELVFRIRQLAPSQRVIMITAYVEDYRVLGKESGNVDALLIKPSPSGN
jgi:CheY-like chemotaxis protein